MRWREGQSKEKPESNIMDNMEYLNDTDKKSIQENSVVSVKPIILVNFKFHFFRSSQIQELSSGQTVAYH